MIQTKIVSRVDNETLNELGFTWYDENRHDLDNLVVVSQKEADNYYEAANTIYDMYVKAAEHVIENNLFFELGIPFNLIDAIKKSWENDVHWHIYGSLSFAGGLDGQGIKLLGFNADTSTSLFETALLQWSVLKFNNLDENKQFNNIYDAISENFKRLITLFDDTELFEERYDGWKILFSSLAGNEEEEATVRLLQQMARDAGFITEFEYMQNTHFDENGIYDADDNEYEYWFKHYTWADIAVDEPELATTLTNIIQNQKAIILNPAYTLLFESNAMMKILNDLFPNSPYLIPTSFEPFTDTKQVEKTAFGQDGLNVKIIESNGEISKEVDGPYGNYKKVYQEYIEFPQDDKGKKYQSQMFFSYEACGLSFQKSSEQQSKQFIGHFIN